MSAPKVQSSILSQLTKEDVQVLFFTYRHRCITEDLAYKRYYSAANIRRAFASMRLNYLKSYKLIEEIDYGEEYPALFLTNLGINAVMQLAEKYNMTEKLLKGSDEWFFAAALRMDPKLINHQIHLNSFAIEFESYARGNVEYTYYDEKFMPPVSGYMMPDAMIELPDQFLLIEMDMNSETYTRLNKRWESYRQFLNDPSCYYSKKPVTMLFVMENVVRVNVRRQTIIKSITKYVIDRVNSTFECYVGTPEEIHRIIRGQILGWDTPERAVEDKACRDFITNFGFNLSTTNFLADLDTQFSFYIRKLTNFKKIEVVDGRPQEFLVDIWLDGRLSIARTLLNYRRVTPFIQSKIKRSISYLVVVPSEQWIYRQLKSLDLYQPNSVYFSTPARLAVCNWEEALFSIDQLGNLSHFQDKTLKTRVHERKL